ncbi:Fe-S cluster assembly protein SufD [Oleisolibacter albus]|uniref:Fe-S cluster assembly protein SufD n=1 Tax=Oleisolibacter albus TaxID=2171757 RepID=UPI000DF258EB|nr:Fe-S cluster assembly protein SufD [Oleisolibacter albus]
MTTTTASPLPFAPFQQAALPGADLPWLADLRRAGRDRFAALGLPTPRNEAWKFTTLRPLEKLSFAPVPADAPAVPVDAIPAVAADSHRLVFVDGRFRPDLSRRQGLPAGVTLLSLGEALSTVPAQVEAMLGRTAAVDGHALLALNAAYLADGVLLHVAKGVTVDRPIELVFLAAGGSADAPLAWHPRLLLALEDNAEATLVEQHLGRDGAVYLSNVAAEVVAGPGARLHHYKLQEEGRDAFHLATLTTRLGRDATYDSFVLNLGARLARHEARSLLDGTGITCRVSGAYAIAGSQHSDITTLIDHAHPHCTSREVVKGVIGGQGRAVFQGKIIVRPDAQKTDGYQLNRALLLSDTAEIDSKPELEIYADDVKCSHGATAGELDDDQLFYLRARGLPLEQARALLVAAFLDEAVDEVVSEPVREHFRSRIHAVLERR